MSLSNGLVGVPMAYPSIGQGNPMLAARQQPSSDPVNMPTGNAYISYHGTPYYAYGSQNGKALHASYDWQTYNEAENYPTSNDYSLALMECTAICDSYTTCRLINVFTITDPSFNSGIPTWNCVFSDGRYDPQAFTDSVAPNPSYVWTQQPPVDPVDMPTDNPYVSKRGGQFFPIGSQNSMILQNTYDNDWSAGPSNYPSSNNYTLALETCTDVCDRDPTCQSFNLFTVSEGDFNSYIPTFECRYSPNLYNPADYFTDNDTPSYVWARQPYENNNGSVPNCTITSNDDFKPDTWVKLGMDEYLAKIAQSMETYGDNYLLNLMGALGWVAYPCTSDVASCTITEINSCSQLLNYQVVGFMDYMKNVENILNYIPTQLQDTGFAIFEQLWSPQPPQAPTFDSWSITKDMINAAINVIPEVGSVIDLVAAPLLELIPQGASAPMSINTNNYQEAWVSFMNDTQSKINSACQAIYQSSVSVSNSSQILDKVAVGGQWLVLDNTGSGLDPDAASMWPTLQPYFWSRVAMQGMAAQDVFFLNVPVSLQGGAGTTCTQANADAIASQFAKAKGANSAGVAWCASADQVIVPVTGYNTALYTAWPTLLSTMGLSGNPAAIFEPSRQCYPDFGSTMALYNTSLTLQPFQGGANPASYDLTQPCAWAIPVCDYTTVYSDMVASVFPKAMKSNSWHEDMINAAGYCAYNWNMISEINFCGKEQECDYQGGCYWTDQCESWKPTKIVTVL